jgi:NIMA (never in mitosis gene a)-related kinase
MENLKQIKLLGEGAFGKCYLCEKPSDGSKYVVKQIDISKMTPQEKKEAYHEAKVMEAFDHPNIIKFIDVYTTTNGKLNIVMNYADGGDLSSKITQQRGKLFSENEVLDIFVQVLLAMKHVHDRKVLHRDIKGQNIFLMKSGLIKLGDFGISKVLTNTVDKARTMVGTPYYLSPEIIENRPYSFKSDVWSLGVLLYELCTLKPPFDGSSLRHLGMNIVRGIYPPPPPHYSRDLKLLISQMLTVDANRRPTVAQILRMQFVKTRIQNLLSESVRFEEFSHTILHKKNLFDKKEKKAEARPETKPVEVKVEPKVEQKKVEIKNIAREDKKDEPKFGLKEFLNKLEEDKKKFARKEPPKPEVKEVPRPKVVDVKKIEEDRKVLDLKIPKYQEPKKPEPAIIKPAPRPHVQAPMQGRLEDVFKPVEKFDKPKKPDPAKQALQDDLRRKKELEAKKKIEELMQKRENEKQEEQAKKEAADKKRQEKMRRILEERAKMKEDIKNKKNLKNSSQGFVGFEIPDLKAQLSEQPELKKQESAEVRSEVPELKKHDFELKKQDFEVKKQDFEVKKQDFELKKQEPEARESESLNVDSLDRSKQMNSSSKAEKPKYSENRQKMIELLRQKRAKVPKNDFVVEWVGVQNPENKRLYQALQEAIDTTEEDSEKSVSEEIYLTQVPEEEIVDRDDEIAGKEVVAQVEKPEESSEEDSQDSGHFNYNSLEAMRMLVEEKVGCELLFEAYKVMGELGDVDPYEIEYRMFDKKLEGLLPKDRVDEFVSYIRTLMIFERKAETSNSN